MRVNCKISEIDLEGYFWDIPSVCALCSRCGHETESYGTSGASRRRCLVLMREECPEGENNFYVDDDEE